MNARPRTLLVVDDEDSVRRLVTTVLETAGYQVLLATEPATAIDIAQSYEGAIDLLITDVTMPEMDGRDVAKRVTTLRPDCRVLFMSGYPTHDDIPNGGLARDAPLLQKPFVPRVLVQRVRELLAE